MRIVLSINLEIRLTLEVLAVWSAAVRLSADHVPTTRNVESRAASDHGLPIANDSVGITHLFDFVNRLPSKLEEKPLTRILKRVLVYPSRRVPLAHSPLLTIIVYFSSHNLVHQVLILEITNQSAGWTRSVAQTENKRSSVFVLVTTH